MLRPFFQSLEHGASDRILLINEVIGELGFNSDGLIPVITQDAQDKQVLMMAWMNKEALEKTLSTGHMTYWSRSRSSLWTKGETSGNTQELVSMSFDCDGDAILCLVNQKGGACHTGRNNCFYLVVDNQRKSVRAVEEPVH